jgi:hypothetical protein
VTNLGFIGGGGGSYGEKLEASLVSFVNRVC